MRMQVVDPVSTQALATASIDRCGTVLETILEHNSSVLGAVMARVDGRAHAHAFRDSGDADPARVAAVSSSLLALSESFSKEALAARARYSSIVTDSGCIVTVRVPSQNRSYLLCVWCDDSENFAMALRTSLDAANQLAAAVDAGS